MAQPTHSIRQLMRRDASLKAIADEAKAQQTLLDELRECLPAELAEHCSAARLRDRRLVISMDSPAWATRLRYLAPQLLESLRPLHSALATIEVKVAVARLRPPGRRRKARRSSVGARIIHECALDTSEEPLREALLRLSRAVASS